MEQKKKRLYRFSIIPDFIKRAKDLSSTEKLLYSEIMSLAESKGYCFAANFHFEHWYRLSKSTVTQSISRLQKLNYIRCEYGRGNYRKIYIVNIPAMVVIHYGSGKNLPSDDEELLDLSSNAVTSVVDFSNNNRKEIDNNKNEKYGKREKRSSDELRPSFSNKDQLESMLLEVLSGIYNRYKIFDIDSIFSSIEEAIERKTCKQDIAQLGLTDWFISVLEEDELEVSEENCSEKSFLSLTHEFLDEIFAVLND